MRRLCQKQATDTTMTCDRCRARCAFLELCSFPTKAFACFLTLALHALRRLFWRLPALPAPGAPRPPFFFPVGRNMFR